MIEIPGDAKPIRDCRLTTIAVAGALSKLVDDDDGLKDQVKAAMNRKGAAFAESDRAVARLQPAIDRKSIDPRRLYQLVESKRITVEQFLGVVKVNRRPLAAHLSGDEIAALTSTSPASGPGDDAGGSLYVEFKPGVAVDVDQLVDAVLQAIQAAQAQAAPGPVSAAVHEAA